jgi:transcriptional regulator NrdR family protein
MNCPYCGSNQVKVDDSRSNGKTVMRRRKCITCNQLFKTRELYETAVQRLERGLENGKIDL